MRLPLLPSLLSLLPTLLPAQTRLLATADLPGRARAAAELERLVRAAADLPTTVALAALAGLDLAPGSAARARLQAALGAALRDGDAAGASGRLRGDLGDLVETLQFQPLVQAELPAGFPGFAAVDELELRPYPAYRMASTAMRGGSTGAFWPLFRHIEANGIAMTTPVQMDWGATAGGGDERPLRMAFLYGDPTTQPGTVADGVDVVVVPAATVLSLGAIGDDRRDRVAAMRDRLFGWLAANPEWLAAGPVRTMGYNSPMVPRDRRYFEVQVPVRRADAPAAVPR